MAIFMDLKGTSQNILQLGKYGPKVKNVSGAFQLRDSGDLNFADLTAAVLKAASDTIELNSDAASSGADWVMTLARPASGMTAAVTYTLPATPTNGYVLQTDGSGNLSWVSPSTPAASNVVLTDSTTIGFGASSPVSLFTLPANAVVHKVQVIVDTAYDDVGATLDIGISGTVDKYMTYAQNDLAGTPKDVYESVPGEQPVGSTEALIGTLSAGSSTVGSVRVIVHYSNPA